MIFGSYRISPVKELEISFYITINLMQMILNNIYIIKLLTFVNITYFDIYFE